MSRLPYPWSLELFIDRGLVFMDGHTPQGRTVVRSRDPGNMSIFLRMFIMISNADLFPNILLTKRVNRISMLGTN